jgi:predicted acylesterase/phospholipase RssA
MACLLAASYSAEELCALAENTSMNDLVHINLMSVFDNWGLDSGTKLEAFIDRLIQQKTGRAKITFAQLYAHSHIRLDVIATNITQATEFRMNFETTPNMPVALGVRMSMTLPPLFSPVRYNNEVYIDGGVMNNFPYETMDPDTTVGFRVDWNNAIDLSTIDRCYSRIVYVALYRLGKVALDRASPTMQAHTIHIDGGDIATINMQVTKEIKHDLNKRARSAVQTWAQHCLFP